MGKTKGKLQLSAKRDQGKPASSLRSALAVDKQLQKDVAWKELLPLLRRARLPDDYPKFSAINQLKARMRTLQGWYDPEKPHLLCRDPDAFVAALYLWVEFYMKPCELNRGVYYFDDPLYKYDMVRQIMDHPVIPTEPAKSIVTATRRTGKTQTIIQEMCPMMALSRPFTRILISEFNDDLTREVIASISRQIEANEIIARDFGGKGVLYPTRKGWDSNILNFLHLPGCAIQGHSLNASQRGRGPIFGVIDDPENEEHSYNQEWRRWYFDRLFNVYLPMFHHGCKAVWIGTPIHRSSCLALALRKLSEKQEEEASLDVRFNDFRIIRCPVIIKDEAGQYVSQQPQRLTVEGFLTKMITLGPSAVAAEFLCDPVTPGQRAFPYNPAHHGFVHAKDAHGQGYLYDIPTGLILPWSTFKRTLLIVGAGDLADGNSADADPGAVVLVGISPEKILYVLDAWEKRCHAEELIEMAYILAESWEAELFGWERTSLQVVINRLAKRHVDKLRAQGRSVPSFRELDNAKRNKTRRILTMIPLFGQKQIRFRVASDYRDSDGRIHAVVPFERQASYDSLLAQVQEFTDEGLRGPDDLIDALEMAVRLTPGRKGFEDEPAGTEPVDLVLEKWENVGFTVPKERIDVDFWTPRMFQEARGDDLILEEQGVMPYV